MSSADSLGKQFDTLMVILKEFLEKVDFWKKESTDNKEASKNFPVGKVNGGIEV